MRLCNCGEKRPFETPPLGKKVCFYVCICMSSITFCSKLKRNPLVCGNFVSKAQLPTYKDKHKKSYKYYEPLKCIIDTRLRKLKRWIMVAGCDRLETTILEPGLLRLYPLLL